MVSEIGDTFGARVSHRNPGLLAGEPSEIPDPKFFTEKSKISVYYFVTSLNFPKIILEVSLEVALSVDTILPAQSQP